MNEGLDPRITKIASQGSVLQLYIFLMFLSFMKYLCFMLHPCFTFFVLRKITILLFFSVLYFYPILYVVTLLYFWDVFVFHSAPYPWAEPWDYLNSSVLVWVSWKSRGSNYRGAAYFGAMVRRDRARSPGLVPRRQNSQSTIRKPDFLFILFVGTRDLATIHNSGQGMSPG